MTRRKREPETAVIDAVTHDGRGIASTDGKKAFVAGALVGETVRFVRRKRRRNYDEAELLDVIEASPERIEPRCAAFGRCGGCSLQHVTPQQQRAIKDQVLRDNLARIGRVEPRRWLMPMTGPDWHYRRRARLAVKDVRGKGRVLVGFREKHAPFITDMLRCEVLAQPLDGMIAALSELVGSLSIRARLPQIEVAFADNASALVFRVLDAPTGEDIKAFQSFGEEHQIRVYLQTSGLDSVARLPGDGGDETLYYTLPEFDVKIEFGPVDFIQVNGTINRQMVSFAVEQLGAGAADRVIDLYCGIGNFSLPLARSAGSVIGVEGDTSLVSRAAANARRNGIDNAEFRMADLSRIDGSESWVRAGCDRMLLDPARNGAAEVMQQMHVFGPQRIVYVSCHPGTLARDAGILVHDKGYVMDAAGIIDMFPHTAHVESIAIFSRSA